jgi:hypothetical protein
LCRREVETTALAVLALLAGLGYLMAFLPPAPVRRIWQASATVEYTKELIARSDSDVLCITNTK